MAKTDVKLYSIDPNAKATTTTISDVNPDATSSQLVQMGRLFNNLTQNTYTKTDRINTINCDTEGGGSQTATITLTTTSCTLADYKAALQSQQDVYEIPFTYDGDATPYAFTSGDSRICSGAYFGNGSGNVHVTTPAQWINLIDTTTTITIRADETDTYKAAEATFTITV